LPKKFSFEILNNEDDEYEVAHEEVLNATQCQGHNKNGARCKRKVIIGYEYCPQHLASIKHLKIADSTIPNAGKGLFAFDRTKGDNDIVFKANQHIIDYKGIIKTDAQIAEQYEGYTAPYAVKAKPNLNIDSAGKRGVASLTNHKARSYINCDLKIKKENNQIVGIQLVAIKNIRNKSELYCNYGDSYKFNDPTRYNTKAYYPRRK
jgi:hypothetical protein